MTVVKRFIAGAVCPRCSEQDKMVMFRNDAQETVRECVRCGYSDRLDVNGKPVMDELTTRVNQPRAGEAVLAHEDEVQVVRLLDPNP